MLNYFYLQKSKKFKKNIFYQKKEVKILAYNKLKGILREKGISYVELASKINLSVAGLSNKINRKKGSDFTVTEVISIKNYLNLLNEDINLIFFT